MSAGIKKETATLEGAAEQLIKAACDAGADAAEVCGTYHARSKVSLEKQDFQLAASDEGFQLGIRVLKGKHQGFASCNSTDAKDLREMAKRAVEIAAFTPANPNWVIKASALVPNEAPRNLWDDQLQNLSLTSQRDWATLMMNEATKDSRFRLNEGSVGVSSGVFLVLNSAGTHQVERETIATWGLMGMAVDGANITSFDYFGELCREAAPVAERIRKTTALFRDRILENLQCVAVHGYRGLVVFSPRAVMDIFLAGLSYHLNGRSLVEGTSRWNWETLGRKLFSPLIQLDDLPWLTDRSGCMLFDREGCPTSNLSLIENGELRNFLLDGYAAAALNQHSTGHALGGPTALPSVGPHSLSLRGGNEPLAKLHQRASRFQREYLLVQRYSGQTDPVTGDFSGVAKGGEWWVGGEKVGCVKETLVAGNLFEALGTGFFGLSTETQVIDSTEEAPTLVCDGISVTGTE